MKNLNKPAEDMYLSEENAKAIEKMLDKIEKEIE